MLSPPSLRLSCFLVELLPKCFETDESEKPCNAGRSVATFTRARGCNSGSCPPNAAFSSQYTECPGGAYGRYGGTALRPSFADQISRHIVCISRSVLFLRMAAFRIRRRSSPIIRIRGPAFIDWLDEPSATSVMSKDGHHCDDQKPSAKQEQTESSATNLSRCDAGLAWLNRKCEV